MNHAWPRTLPAVCGRAPATPWILPPTVRKDLFLAESNPYDVMLLDSDVARILTAWNYSVASASPAITRLSW